MKIETTNSPNDLCNVLQGLTDAQKSDIRDMGFQFIMSFTIHSIPPELGYWLLLNYDHQRNELNVGSHIVEITPSKVHDVLGVPMGDIPVYENKRGRKMDIFRNEWRKQSFPYPSTVFVKHVVEKLKSCTQGGTLIFKLNFLVVFNSIMGETGKRGTAKRNFLSSIKDEADIPNLDWCSYIITCLKRTKEGWNGEEPYNGPLTLLAVLYAHEQQLRRSPENAITPAIQYVTTDFLVDLEGSMRNEVQVKLETHVESAEGQTAVDQNIIMNFAARFKPHFTETHNIKTECLGTATCCQRFFYDPPQSVTEVKGKRKRNNNALEKQVTSSEDNAKIYVQGYEVKQSVAQTLEAILKKHGDIAANCIFKTSSMTSPILEVVCEIVKQIETNDVHEKMEDIERQVSDAEAVNIDVAWLRADLKAICEKPGSFERSNLVKETTKHTLLIERAARKDLEEMDVEVVAARERVGLAELLVNVFTIVENNLDDKVLECKVKGDSWV